MERFHFHTQDGRCLADPTGTELESLGEAKQVAVQHLVETLNHNGSLFWDTEAFSVIVTDDTGLTLFVLDLSVTMSAATQPRARGAIQTPTNDRDGADPRVYGSPIVGH
jgi:hypothetical protein